MNVLDHSISNDNYSRKSRDFVCFAHGTIFIHKYRDAHFVLLNYTCQAIGETDVRLNSEAEAFRWVSPSDALSMSLNEPTRILIQAVLRLNGETRTAKTK